MPGSEERKGRKEREVEERRVTNKHRFITRLSCVADIMCAKLLFLTSFPYHGLGMRSGSSHADLESSLKLFKRNLSIMISVKRCHYLVQSGVTSITELRYLFTSDVTFAL